MWSEMAKGDKDTLEDLVKSEMENTSKSTGTPPHQRPPPTRRTKHPQSQQKDGSKESTPSEDDAKAKDEEMAKVRKETVAKETQVRHALHEQQEKLRQESQRLATIDAELKKLSVKEQADISILRAQLEEIDRKLFYLRGDMKRKEEAYAKAKEAFDSMDAKKRSMHEHLALMVLSSEKRKEDKLNELMAKMNSTNSSGGSSSRGSS